MKKENRLLIFQKYLGKCAYCGCSIEESKFEVDHFLPKHKGGSDGYMNLMPACRNCNRAKKTYTLSQWRKVLQNKVNELKKLGAYNQATKFGLIEETGKLVKFYYESNLDYETIVSFTRGISSFNDT